MRYAWLCAAGMMIAGLSLAQESKPIAPESLLDLLAEESIIAYRLDTDAQVYRLKLISDALAEESREYYSNRSANVTKWRKLEQQRKAAVERKLYRTARTHAAEAVDTETAKDIGAQMAKVARPTADYRVGEITRRGRDFIGIQELGSDTEFLIPLDRILFVALPPQYGMTAR